MRNDALREYRQKLYLNASHYVIFGDKKSERHPHTWEFTIEILVTRDRMIKFGLLEERIGNILAPYQDKLVNDVPPFDHIIPTLENMLDYFADLFFDAVREVGGLLVKIEASETPTRTCIYSFRGRDEFLHGLKTQLDTVTHNMILAVVDESIPGYREPWEE